MINEKDFKTILKCPKYYFFNGPDPEPIQTKLLNKLHSRVTLFFLKNEKLDRSQIYNHLLTIFSQSDLKDIPQADRRDLINKTNIYINESLNIFDISKYAPIYGPLLFNYNLKNTAISLKVNGVFKSLKNKSLHFVYFSSENKHYIQNDPLIKYKLSLLSTLVPDHHLRAFDAYAHVFYFVGEDLKREVITLDDSLPRHYEAISDIIINKNYYPILPCTKACKYKKICK